MRKQLRLNQKGNVLETKKAEKGKRGKEKIGLNEAKNCSEVMIPCWILFTHAQTYTVYYYFAKKLQISL